MTSVSGRKMDFPALLAEFLTHIGHAGFRHRNCDFVVRHCGEIKYTATVIALAGRLTCYPRKMGAIVTDYYLGAKYG
jgi:hypothetical protein